MIVAVLPILTRRLKAPVSSVRPWGEPESGDHSFARCFRCPGEVRLRAGRLSASTVVRVARPLPNT